MLRRKKYFPRAMAPERPQTVDGPPSCNRNEPGFERARRIVSVADRVDRQQDVLHRVFALRILESARTEFAQIWRDGPQQCAVSGGIAVLRPRHQRGPFAVAFVEVRLVHIQTGSIASPPAPRNKFLSP